MTKRRDSTEVIKRTIFGQFPLKVIFAATTISFASRFYIKSYCNKISLYSIAASQSQFLLITCRVHLCIKITLITVFLWETSLLYSWKMQQIYHCVRLSCESVLTLCLSNKTFIFALAFRRTVVLLNVKLFIINNFCL